MNMTGQQYYFLQGLCLVHSKLRHLRKACRYRVFQAPMGDHYVGPYNLTSRAGGLRPCRVQIVASNGTEDEGQQQACRLQIRAKGCVGGSGYLEGD
jgi:hypothetical protein